MNIVTAPQIIGRIQRLTIDLIGLTVPCDREIFLSEYDHLHMQTDHPSDYEKYFGNITDILQSPNYLAKHPRKQSVEHIKVFGKDYVLVPVHVTSNNKLFAKTIFVMEPRKVQKYFEVGAMIKYE